MNAARLVLRGLGHYRRTHVGVLIGAAVATAVIVGALAVGDSVRASLRRLALVRLGRIGVALGPGERLFRPELADEVAASLETDVAAVMILNGTASRPEGAPHATRVQVVGVDRHFWGLHERDEGADAAGPELAIDEAAVNRSLAVRMRLHKGDVIVLRTRKAGAIPGDSALAHATRPRAMRLTVKAVLDDTRMGRFSLRIGQTAPYNVFVARSALARREGSAGQANALLVADRTELTCEVADAALRSAWRPTDAGLLRHVLPDTDTLEWQSRRVFMDPPVVDALRASYPDCRTISTYFVNSIECGDRATPYSFVSAAGGTVVPDGTRDNEIVINDWLANDLRVAVGAELTLRYFRPERDGELHETQRVFLVKAIVPLEGAAADPTLMPAFPGLADAESCRDWDPGPAIDLKRIRPEDETYWKEHRGTPKAFVTSGAAEAMWGSRLGYVTAVRVAAAEAAATPDAVSAMMSRLDPAALGLFFAPVREAALRAGQNAVDFGQLFIGLSFFIVVAALTLTGMLFSFSVEQRTGESGLLLALGFPLRTVRWLIFAEGGALALIGACLGVPLGLAYNRVAIAALNTVWRGAVATSSLRPAAGVLSVVAGSVVGVLTAAGAMALSLRRISRRPLSELQAQGGAVSGALRLRTEHTLWAGGAVCLSVAVAIVAIAGRDPSKAAGAFFSAGGLLLAASMLGAAAGLSWLARRRSSAGVSLLRLALSNAARGRGRSLATMGVLACGVFIIMAVGANRNDPGREAALRSSGTGGYALYGETALPITEDIDTPGAHAFKLGDRLPAGVHIVQLRATDGDDASCLNLNRVAQPRLIGVDGNVFAQESRFSFAAVADTLKGENPWAALSKPEDDGTIPAIADQTVIVWGLGKKLGDVITYVDERGRPVRLRLVAGLANSIFQGSLLVDRELFARHFPSASSGSRILLVDAPREARETALRELEATFRDWGLELVPAAGRLAEFTRVEQTYLSIFLALGGLGLVIGCLGLAVVVLRNGVERRGELAVLRAVGYSRGAIRGLFLGEHILLLVCGLVIGAVSAAVAVVPALVSSGAGVPYVLIVATLCGILVSGLVWTLLASWLGTRGSMLPALRDE